MDVAVIGAGPAGWAAASKLLSLGHKVTVFTGDMSEEDEDPANHGQVKTKINTKLLRGSNFPYRGFPVGPKNSQVGVNLASSFAISGLSLVWGATMLPYTKTDLELWPITPKDLEAGYKFVMKHVPVAGRIDHIATKYDPYINQNNVLPTKRISTFLRLAERTRHKDITCGSSRLAVQTTTSSTIGCNYCGRCLTGCPIDKIWFAPKLESSLIQYQKNFRVVSLVEENDKVSVNAIDLSGKSFNFHGFDKIFVAAGNIETFRILATSKFVKPQAENRDSSTFFVPILLSRRYKKPEKQKNTLSQIFIRQETENSGALQLQLYDYSDDLISRARQVHTLVKFIPSWLLRLILSRFIVGIGYLDSQFSTSVAMSLDDYGNVNLGVARECGNEKKLIVKKMFKESKPFFKGTGSKAITQLIQYALPGEGVHSGGWLPMGKDSDLQGRPAGCLNVHVVDSSVFPTIPPGAITFTVMANACRIVELAIR